MTTQHNQIADIIKDYEEKRAYMQKNYESGEHDEKTNIRFLTVVMTLDHVIKDLKATG